MYLLIILRKWRPTQRGWFCSLCYCILKIVLLWFPENGMVELPLLTLTIIMNFSMSPMSWCYDEPLALQLLCSYCVFLFSSSLSLTLVVDCSRMVDIHAQLSTPAAASCLSHHSTLCSSSNTRTAPNYAAPQMRPPFNSWTWTGPYEIFKRASSGKRKKRFSLESEQSCTLSIRASGLWAFAGPDLESAEQGRGSQV